MFLTEEISNALSSKFSLVNSEEKFEAANFKMIGYDITLPSEDTLLNLFSKINSQDKFEIELTLAETTTITFQSSKNTVPELINELKAKQQFYNKGEIVELRFTIIKKKINSQINIYDISAFTQFLQSLNVEELLINFSNLLSDIKCLVFNCIDINYSFNTQTIYFCQTAHIHSQDNPNFIRDEVLDRVNDNCSFTMSQSIILIPEDFSIIQSDVLNREIYEIFNRILSILVIISIFDITSFKENQLAYKLNGYKSINGFLQIDKPIKTYNDYYKIYLWVYTGGNLTDKIGLARNIISLHFKEKDGLDIDDNTYISIISSHKVYEKQNIKQYIELRNKISDQVYSFNEKANKIIEGFASGFQKSALAFVTLFSTIVITKVLTTKNFNNIFTFDATIISLLFLIGSLIYFFVSVWEVNAQLNRFKSSYINMRIRNEDLLTKDDIDKILNSDTEHSSDLEFIKQKRFNYSILWLSFLVLFLITTLFLHWEYSKANPKESNMYSIFQSKQKSIINNESNGSKKAK